MRQADMTYVDGYCDGWAEAIAAITDLVLAGRMDFIAAQHQCMDWHNRQLIHARHKEELPEMQRPRLAVVALPFTDWPPQPADGEAADAALAVELGVLGAEGEEAWANI